MTKPYVEGIVYTESEDGVFLEGALIRPSAGDVGPFPVVWIHGFTGRFYEPHAIRIGRELASRGYVYVTGNNRGHNYGAILHPKGREPYLGGAAWEKLDESPNDVSAWISYALGLGFQQVALLGHSLGGLKVAYYQATRQDPRVRGLILASMPMKMGPPDPGLLAEAERMVAEGRGQDLLPWGIRPGAAGTVSAQTFLSRTRMRFDVARVRCPLFAFLGTNEEQIGTAAELESLRQQATGAARVDTRVVDGADHVYTGLEAQVAGIIADWVAKLR